MITKNQYPANSWSWLRSALTKGKILDELKILLLENSPISASIYFKANNNTMLPVFLDSFLLKKCIQPDLQSKLETEINSMIKFVPRENTEMLYGGNTLNRDNFFLNGGPVDGSGNLQILRKYGYPGFQWASMLHYRPFTNAPILNEFISNLQETFTFCGKDVHFNHAIGTKYSRAEDDIGYHHDKMLDITEDTPIVSISLGGRREFHFCYPGNEKKYPDQIVLLEAGDVFILDLKPIKD